MTTTAERPTWSKSKISALNECKRKLFFSNSKDVAQFKNIKNRHLWIGSLIHERIADLIKTARQEAPIPAMDSFLAETRDRMRAEYQTSKTKTEPSERLFEHEFNIPVAREAWQAGWDKVEKSITWFYSSPWFRRLQEMKPEMWKAVDEVLDFDIEGVKAYVKIDCALEVDGQFILIDWTSSSSGNNDPFSLHVAALYAHDVWGADPDQVSAHSVSLIDGKSQRIALTEDVLMETHLRIQEEAAVLQEESSTWNADALSIPATANLNTCARCNFQRLCHPKGVFHGAD